MTTGGGTAGSAVQLLKSKDTMFQKTGVSRLRMIHKAGRTSYMAPAIEQDGVETLLDLIVTGLSGVTAMKSGGGGGWWGGRRRKVVGGDGEEEAGAGVGAGAGAGSGTDGVTWTNRENAEREVATEALECLAELAASDDVLGLMASREGLVDAVLKASRDKNVDKDARAQLSAIHGKMTKKKNKTKK